MRGCKNVSLFENVYVGDEKWTAADDESAETMPMRDQRTCSDRGVSKQTLIASLYHTPKLSREVEFLLTIKPNPFNNFKKTDTVLCWWSPTSKKFSIVDIVRLHKLHLSLHNSA
jgi:hypothetical protein